MFRVRNVLPLLLVVLFLCGLSFGATKIVPTGYATIQLALNAADPCDIIEVQSNATFTENLLFKKDVNGLTLRAGTGFFPTITVTGTGGTPPPDTNEFYISINSTGTTLQGFTITFAGTPYTVDNNSFIIFAKGGPSTVRDCNIIGPGNGWTRGIGGVNDIDHVEISQFRQAILCDTNWFDTGFNYSIRNSWIHDNYYWGLIFSDCNAVVDNCLVERSGNNAAETANIITQGATRLLLNLSIKNSTIRNMLGTPASRNLRLQTPGTVTIDDCVIYGATADEILQYRGTLNLNRCILKNSTVGGVGGVIAITNNEGQGTGSTTNIDHCSLAASEASTQWNIWTQDANCHVTVTNSILTGPQGYHTAATIGEDGSFISNYNDNDCNSPISAPAVASGVAAGPQDLRQTAGGARFNPYYIQIADSDVNTYFALQPYSTVIGKGSSGSDIGAKGVIYGHERWPADLDGVYGVDKRDLKYFASDWLDDSNIVQAGPNEPLDNFESYSVFPDANWTILDWAYDTALDHNYIIPGSQTLSLINSVGGGYDSNKAMKWEYDVNATTGGGRFVEILMILPHTIDINIFPDANGQPGSRFNQLKFMLKRYAGNSPDSETYMYVRFLDKTRYPNTNDTVHQKQDIVYQVFGGQTAFPPGEWAPWSVNLNNMAKVAGGPVNLTKISGIVVGIHDQTMGPWGVGKGFIDVDKIELIDTPGCTGYTASDLNRDCTINFRDYVIFANYWLDGRSGQ